MERQKNDDTLTKLGDIFHYLIVLENCLELKEGEIIYVEKFGDLSKLSRNESKNVEIKHHKDKHNLSERNIDFWNTLKNWIENKDNMSNFKKLILLTTSILPLDSPFISWNAYSPKEKLNIIKSIGVQKKKKETAFRELYDQVFSYNQSLILEVLQKVELYTGEPNITKRKNRLLQNPVFLLIEDDKIDSFIEELMGYILMKPTEPSHNWEITYDEFKAKAIEVRNRYSKGVRPLPSDYEYRTPLSLVGYEDKTFVKEIKRIENDEEILDAITNYWRAQQTLIEYFHDHPVYLLDVSSYREDLVKRLNRMFRKSGRECKSEVKEDILESSKQFYDNVMLLDAMPFGTINPNRDFFQQGVIHEIVDGGQLVWYLKEEV